MSSPSTFPRLLDRFIRVSATKLVAYRDDSLNKFPRFTYRKTRACRRKSRAENAVVDRELPWKQVRIGRKGKEEEKVAGCKMFPVLSYASVSPFFPRTLPSRFFASFSAFAGTELVCAPYVFVRSVQLVYDTGIEAKEVEAGFAWRWWKPDITPTLTTPLDTFPEQGRSHQHQHKPLALRRSSSVLELLWFMKANFLFVPLLLLRFLSSVASPRPCNPISAGPRGFCGRGLSKCCVWNYREPVWIEVEPTEIPRS